MTSKMASALYQQCHWMHVSNVQKNHKDSQNWNSCKHTHGNMERRGAADGAFDSTVPDVLVFTQRRRRKMEVINSEAWHASSCPLITNILLSNVIFFKRLHSLTLCNVQGRRTQLWLFCVGIWKDTKSETWMKKTTVQRRGWRACRTPPAIFSYLRSPALNIYVQQEITSAKDDRLKPVHTFIYIPHTVDSSLSLKWPVFMFSGLCSSFGNTLFYKFMIS